MNGYRPHGELQGPPPNKGSSVCPAPAKSVPVPQDEADRSAAQRKNYQRTRAYRDLRESLLRCLALRGIDEGLYRDKVQEYMDNVVAKAKEEGFVSTIFGRRRYLNDIASHNAIARGLAERNAVNAPIQGSAADIMKIAMINVHRRFAAEGIRSKVILQVHDELVVDMLRSEQERVVAIVTEAMESAAALKVRLVVDYGVGGNWLEAH